MGQDVVHYKGPFAVDNLQWKRPAYGWYSEQNNVAVKKFHGLASREL